MRQSFSRAIRSSLLSLLVLVSISVQAARAATQRVYRNRVAICIGINDYQAFPNLGYAGSDASDMAEVFEDYGFDEVVLLTGGDANRETILNEMARIKDGAHENDLFVFYFAGHGRTVRQSNRLSGYLVTGECRKGREAQDGIPMSALAKMAEDMPSRHNLFLTDACFSGFGLAGVDTRDALEGRSVQILTAGREKDLAFESDGHGVFTRHVLDCLQGRNSRGVVSVTKLASLVTNGVSHETGGWQKPQFGRVGNGDVVLARLESRRDANSFAQLK